MANIHKVITILSPVQKVFSFMNDPHNLPEIWPSMVEIKNVKRNPNGGYNFGWVYKMGGVHFDGASETIEFVENKRIVTKSVKGIESKFAWDYEAVNDGTRITLEIEYKVPVPLVGKIAEAILIKQNEREADILFENLKNRMEMETPVAV